MVRAAYGGGLFCGDRCRCHGALWRRLSTCVALIGSASADLAAAGSLARTRRPRPFVAVQPVFDRWYDLDGDGAVTLADVIIVAAQWDGG